MSLPSVLEKSPEELSVRPNLVDSEEELGIEIPETDAGRLTTIDACVR